MGFQTLDLVFAAVALLGGIGIGIALVSLLRRFIPGSKPPTPASAEREWMSIGWLSLGIAAAVGGLVGLALPLVADVTPEERILWALAAGLVAGLVLPAIWLYLTRPQSDEDRTTPEQVIGRSALVVISIPENGLGEISLESADGAWRLAARSASGTGIAAGVKVVVERYSNRVAVVHPLDGGTAGRD